MNENIIPEEREIGVSVLMEDNEDIITTPTGSPATDKDGQIAISKYGLKDLLRPPPDLAVMRQKMFILEEKIELRISEFECYWPYIDNVWVRQHRASSDKTGQIRTDYYACRLQRPTYTPKSSEKPRSDEKPARKKQIREGGTCQMRLKTVRFDGGYSSITIMRVGDQVGHTHDLDRIDKIKRPTIIMDIARSEVMKGYMPASVFTIMSEDFDKLAVAGGTYLSRNDVRNASQTWRQAHREPLQVHRGYQYDQGNGITRNEDGPLPALQDVFEQIAKEGSAAQRKREDTLHFATEYRLFLEPYLPSCRSQDDRNGLPHVTLTYAASMDSCIALAPGMQTQLSGPESKAMTHYLRSRHDAILVGVGTAIADDPGLNCRLEGVGGYGGLGWECQPRPVIIDPGARWLVTPESRILKTVQEGKGRGPWIIMAPGYAMDPTRLELLKVYGGKYLGLIDFDKSWRLRWEAILMALAAEGVRSVMIEGGATVINDLLKHETASLVSSLIVTIAPTYLGKGGLFVNPSRSADAAGQPQPPIRLQEVRWQPLGGDMVMCCKPSAGLGSAFNGTAHHFGDFSGS